MLDFNRWYRGMLRAVLRPVLRRHLTLSVPMRANNHTWRLPLIEGIEVPGVADNWKSRVLACLLPLRDGTFFDIGANLGQTLLDLRRTDPDRFYVGFEPNPTCVYYIRRLIELNGFECNSIIVGAAVAECARVARLYSRMGTRADESATLIAGLRPQRKLACPVHVPVVSLDEVCVHLSTTPTAIAKIDVEGAELNVMSGMRRLLARDRPFILCEVLPAPRGSQLDATRERHAALEALIRENDFTILNVRRDSRGGLVGLARIDSFPLRYWSPETRHEHDYIFVHHRAHDDVMRAVG